MDAIDKNSDGKNEAGKLPEKLVESALQQLAKVLLEIAQSDKGGYANKDSESIHTREQHDQH